MEVVSIPETPLLAAQQVARVSWKLQEQPQALAAHQVLLALLALRLLQAACSGKVVAVVEEAMQAQAVRAVLEVEALAVGVVQVVAARTLQVQAVSAATAGYWCWSIDYGPICFDRC